MSQAAARPSSHCFNPRARVGRDQDLVLPLSGLTVVSIHAPAWGATYGRHDTSLALVCFNPRTRVGRDVGLHIYSADPAMFQSTRPRGARHGLLSYQCHNCGVSIHAPAWGATGNTAAHLAVALVSIHAPAWGATWLSVHADQFDEVSIHAPAWGATSDNPTLDDFYHVSIHAPAWGATTAPVSRHRPGDGFNPRARVGRDLLLISARNSPVMFQSTRPRGARLPITRRWMIFITFQSTRPRGARLSNSCPTFTRIVFQSTRPRGARRRAVPGPAHAGQFQSTRPRGARPAGLSTIWDDVVVSIHAPAWGATCGRCSRPDRT